VRCERPVELGIDAALRAAASQSSSCGNWSPQASALREPDDPAGYEVDHVPDELEGKTYHEPSENGEERDPSGC